MTENLAGNSRFSKYHPLLMIVSILIIAVFFLFPPVTILDKTYAIGYGICHQFPARTFHLGGMPLPLCARCTGIYLGALMGIVGMILAGRQWSVELPPTRVLLVLVGFIGLMGIDGVNSYLGFFPNAPQLYEPQNWLRLTTGTLHGLAISTIVFPIVNVTLWQAGRVKYESVIKGFKELLPFLAGAVAIILIVLWEHPLLLYPLAILSTLGVILMLGMLNTAFILVLTRREGYARTWKDVVLPMTMGLAAAFLLIGGMDLLRSAVTRATGVPF
jgi:uncharacterized membrane protein